jgi:hypothetical protein
MLQQRMQAASEDTAKRLARLEAKAAETTSVDEASVVAVKPLLRQMLSAELEWHADRLRSELRDELAQRLDDAARAATQSSEVRMHVGAASKRVSCVGSKHESRCAQDQRGENCLCRYSIRH